MLAGIVDLFLDGHGNVRDRSLGLFNKSVGCGGSVLQSVFCPAGSRRPFLGRVLLLGFVDLVSDLLPDIPGGRYVVLVQAGVLQGT